VSDGGQRIGVCVVDDHPVLREGLVRVIKANPRLERVGEAGDGRTALDLIREREPDVALLDHGLPGLNGIQVLEAIQRDKIPTKVVLFSGSLENDEVYRALAAGVSGIVSKTVPRNELYDVIEKVMRGDTVVGPEFQTGLADEVRAHQLHPNPILSERQLEVLRLTADGLSANAIGEKLHISPATVRTHLAHVYEKLEVSDRAAAVAEAMRRGLVE
jgi:two-component system, NarL family, nitrate/nitrite response regulator NarL